MFVRVLRRDTAHTPGQHDGLVTAALLAIHIFFKGAEVSGQIGTTEFVVECRAANWPFQHDLQGGGDARGSSISPTALTLPSPACGRGFCSLSRKRERVGVRGVLFPRLFK